MDNFGEYLREEIKKRKWKQADLSRASNLDSAVISNLINGRRGPGEDTCRAIAHAFGYPVEQVYREAGLLPKEPGYDPLLEEAEHLLAQLPQEKQEEMLALLRYMADQHRKKGTINHDTKPRLANSHS